MTLICAKFDADLINISKVTSRKTKWPQLFGLPGIYILLICLQFCVNTVDFLLID